MRLLRGDLLRAHCRAPLDQVSVIDLRRFGVESLNPSSPDFTTKEKTTTVHIVLEEATTTLESEEKNVISEEGGEEQQQQQQEEEEDEEEGGESKLTPSTSVFPTSATTNRSWEYSGDPLGQCTILEVLLLSENRLTNLAGLECCQSRLWKLDVHSNIINDLSAFFSFEQLGVLDLSQNLLTYSVLVQLSHVHIMSLLLSGNKDLTGGSGAVYRRNVIHLLPLIWSLDGCIVTAEERRTASEFFASFSDVPIDEVPDEVRTILSLSKKIGAPRGRVEEGGGEGEKKEQQQEQAVTAAATDGSSIFAWGSAQFVLGAPTTPATATTVTTTSANASTIATKTKSRRSGEASSVLSWSSPTPLPSDCLTNIAFKDVLLRQPFSPYAQDTFRLSQFVKFHNHASEIHRKYFELNAPKVGTNIIDPGDLKMEHLLPLSPRVRLDIAILMAVSVEFDIPHTILQDALSLLLQLDLKSSHIDALAHLPKYGRSLICRSLSDIGRIEAAGSFLVVSSSPHSYTELEVELLHAIPISGKLAPFDSVSDTKNEDRTSLELRARHSIILLSRSPSFPPLLQSKQLGNAGVRMTYSRLLPLLRVGGMAANDLAEDASGEDLWKHAVLKPARDYPRPWAVAGSSDQLDNKEVPSSSSLNSPGFPEDQLDTPAATSSPTSLADLRRIKTKPRLHEGSFFEKISNDDDVTPPFVLLEEEPSSTAAYYPSSRLPKVGEKVEISYEPGKSYFPLIVDITDESNAVMLEPLQNVMGTISGSGTEEGGATDNIWLGIRELMWNPNGYWRHSSAIQMSTLRMNARTRALASRLHRSSSGLSRSGVHRSSGVNNVSIDNSILLTTMEEGEKGEKEDQAPKTIGGFSAAGTWDPQFVLAPPTLVEAQNMAAGGGRGGSRGSRGATWKAVEQPEFSAVSGPSMNYRLVEKAVPLGAPPPSAVYTLLQEQLVHNETLKEELKNKEVDEEMTAANHLSVDSSSSFFDLTSLPNEKDQIVVSTKEETGTDVNVNVSTTRQELVPPQRPESMELSVKLVAGDDEKGKTSSVAMHTIQATTSNEDPLRQEIVADIASRSLESRGGESSMERRGGGGGDLRPTEESKAATSRAMRRSNRIDQKAARHEMGQIMTAARVGRKKKAAGASAWYVKQPKATLVVDELSLHQHAMYVKRNKSFTNLANKDNDFDGESREDERSKLVRKVANIRQRASRTKFTTLKGAVDANMDLMRNKGQAARELVRVAPHRFVPVLEAVPTPLLPNTSLGSGVKSRARQQRVNRWKRSSGTTRRQQHLVISASAPSLKGRK